MVNVDECMYVCTPGSMNTYMLVYYICLLCTYVCFYVVLGMK